MKCEKCGGKLGTVTLNGKKQKWCIECGKRTPMPTAEVEVFAPGTPCFLGFGQDRFAGEVMAAGIFPGRNVQYLCVWWNGRDRYEEWLNDFEMEQVQNTPKTIKVGFSQ